MYGCCGSGCCTVLHYCWSSTGWWCCSLLLGPTEVVAVVVVVVEAVEEAVVEVVEAVVEPLARAEGNDRVPSSVRMGTGRSRKFLIFITIGNYLEMPS